MRNYPIISLCVSMGAVLTACQTLPTNDPLQVYESNKGGASSVQTLGKKTDQEYAIAPRLSARDLKRGDCGLFIWSADQDRRFLLFSQAQKNKAIWAGPNGEQDLSIVQKAGQVYQQQYTQQGFAEYNENIETQKSPNLKLSLRNIEETLEATRFKAGTLSQMTDDGLDRIVPVVGLSTCR